MIKTKPIVIANWKMKLGLSESVALAKAVRRIGSKDIELVICPSFISLTEAAKVLKGSQIKLGAQDCFWEAEGAFTGEVSAGYLKEVGGEFVILGHSERRQYLGETDGMVHRKVKMALMANLIPILCVGETFDQRQQGATDYVLIQQVTKALEGAPVGLEQRLIIAYEPVWVIGSGQAINPEQAATAHQVIRQTLFDLFPASLVKSNFAVIYGGSVDGANVASFTGLDNTAGVLVGGASLKIDKFTAIIKNI